MHAARSGCGRVLSGCLRADDRPHGREEEARDRGYVGQPQGRHDHRLHRPRMLLSALHLSGHGCNPPVPALARHPQRRLRPGRQARRLVTVPAAASLTSALGARGEATVNGTGEGAPSQVGSLT